MKQIKAMVMGLACLLAAGTANAQWVVSDPGNLYNGEEYAGRIQGNDKDI